MKCPYCGSPLSLEDEYCSFCGQRNELAKKHQTEMNHYKNEFARTQQEVYTKTRRFASLTVPLIIIFILFVLNIGAVIFSMNAWDMGSALLKKKIENKADEHHDNLNAYIQTGDYYGFSSYYNTNSLYMVDKFREYRAAVDVADSYFQIYRSLVDTSEYGNYNLNEENISSTVRYMTQNLDSIFNVEQNYSYNSELYFSDNNLKMIHNIQDQTKAILVTYGGLTMDEADELPDLSSGRQKEILERRLREL